jgi:hypothetical protein
MNTTAIPIDELICQPLDAAEGILADTAAVKLIISHENFLHRDAFHRIIRAGTSISTGQPLAVIGWDAALCALEAGQMPCASSERAILRIAASLGDRKSPSACAPSLATSIPVTSPWSLTPSPPRTANQQTTPKSSARQPAAAGATASGAAWPSDRLPHPCWP